MSLVKLNLGCSDDHKPGYINVDMGEPADVICDLSKPWDDVFPENYADEVFAHDVAEHLPSKTFFMNQVWRVLKPGGLLDLAVPCVMLADGRVNSGAFADPTHRTFWTLDDKYYYCTEWNNSSGERGRLGPNPSYGIKALFDIQSWTLVEYGKSHERRSKIIAKLRASKTNAYA